MPRTSPRRLLGTAVTAHHADDAVRDLVLAHLDSPDFVALAGMERGRRSGDPASRALARELAALDEGLVSTGDRWLRGEISREEWLSQRQPLAQRSVDVRAEMERLGRLEAAHWLANTGATLGARWSALTVKEQRDILHAVLDRVVVVAAVPPRQVFKPERLQPVWIK